MAGARGFSSRATMARRSGESVRIVPSISALSGMMLFVVPAAIFAMVTTAGSKTEMRRVTMVWIAVTIDKATGLGSTASCGIDACPTAPLTMIERTSSKATTGPERPGQLPGGAVDQQNAAQG